MNNCANTWLPLAQYFIKTLVPSYLSKHVKIILIEQVKIKICEIIKVATVVRTRCVFHVLPQTGQLLASGELVGSLP